MPVTCINSKLVFPSDGTRPVLLFQVLRNWKSSVPRDVKIHQDLTPFRKFLRYFSEMY